MMTKDTDGLTASGSFARVVAGMLDLHDPTAAGHQAEVAAMARSIALDMGHHENLAHCVFLAGQVHDIGKVLIPPEILAIPGKLNKIQHAIISRHPSIGYDIVQPAGFPSSVASAVHQHHERLNGSGYPLGLRGEAITLEARILAVADVVQAMQNRRTYHPPLDITDIMDELEKNSGILYDGEVVASCIHLLTNKDIQFASS